MSRSFGARFARLFLLLGTLSVAPAAALRETRGELEATLLERTEGLFELARHWQRSEPRALFLNGARMIVATGTSEQPLPIMLDHFQALCRQRSGGVHDEVRRRTGRAELPSWLDGVLRADDGEAGLVACFDLGRAFFDGPGLLARVERFAETSDLQELGGLRVVRVQALGDRSFFVAVWNDGPAALAAMFPEVGDAPGLDFEGVPRPAGAVRWLSAWQSGADAGLNVYRVSGDLESSYASYLQSLEEAGWTAADARGFQSGAQAYAGAFQRAGRTLVVHVGADAEGSLISVLPGNLGPAFVSSAPSAAQPPAPPADNTRVGEEGGR